MKKKNTLNKIFYSIISILLLSSCAGTKINKILKQGNVLQTDFKTTIPFTYVNGWIVLEVEIQNKTYNFLLDTGSSNLLTKELAEELNIKSLGTEEIGDINGKTNETEYTRVKNIKIANIDFQNTIAGILDLNKVPEISCTKIDGFIGSNLMRKAVWDFDFQKQLITITNNENKLDISEETIESKLFIGTAGIPSVIVDINGQRTLNNTVDLGNSGGVLLRTDYFNKQIDEKKIKKYVKGNHKSFGVFGRTETEPFYNVIIDEMKIGNHNINNLLASVLSGSDGNLGLSFFKNYRLVLNWHTKKMKMTPISDAGNGSYKGYGFDTLYQNENVFVSSIVETSSASEFLELGDQIVNVNNENYLNVTIEQYCDILTKVYGSETLPITVLRNGKEFTFELKKTKLL